MAGHDKQRAQQVQTSRVLICRRQNSGVSNMAGPHTTNDTSTNHNSHNRAAGSSTRDMHQRARQQQQHTAFIQPIVNHDGQSWVSTCEVTPETSNWSIATFAASNAQQVQQAAKPANAASAARQAPGRPASSMSRSPTGQQQKRPVQGYAYNAARKASPIRQHGLGEPSRSEQHKQLAQQNQQPQAPEQEEAVETLLARKHAAQAIKKFAEDLDAANLPNIRIREIAKNYSPALNFPDTPIHAVPVANCAAPTSVFARLQDFPPIGTTYSVTSEAADGSSYPGTAPGPPSSMNSEVPETLAALLAIVKDEWEWASMAATPARSSVTTPDAAAIPVSPYSPASAILEVREGAAAIRDRSIYEQADYDSPPGQLRTHYSHGPAGNRSRSVSPNSAGSLYHNSSYSGPSSSSSLWPSTGAASSSTYIGLSSGSSTATHSSGNRQVSPARGHVSSHPHSPSHSVAKQRNSSTKLCSPPYANSPFRAVSPSGSAANNSTRQATSPSRSMAAAAASSRNASPLRGALEDSSKTEEPLREDRTPYSSPTSASAAAGAVASAAAVAAVMQGTQQQQSGAEMLFCDADLCMTAQTRPGHWLLHDSSSHSSTSAGNNPEGHSSRHKSRLRHDGSLAVPWEIPEENPTSSEWTTPVVTSMSHNLAASAAKHAARQPAALASGVAPVDASNSKVLSSSALDAAAAQRASDTAFRQSYGQVQLLDMSQNTSFNGQQLCRHNHTGSSRMYTSMEFTEKQHSRQIVKSAAPAALPEIDEQLMLEQRQQQQQLGQQHISTSAASAFDFKLPPPIRTKGSHSAAAGRKHSGRHGSSGSVRFQQQLDILPCTQHCNIKPAAAAAAHSCSQSQQQEQWQQQQEKTFGQSGASASRSNTAAAAHNVPTSSSLGQGLQVSHLQQQSRSINTQTSIDNPLYNSNNTAPGTPVDGSTLYSTSSAAYASSSTDQVGSGTGHIASSTEKTASGTDGTCGADSSIYSMNSTTNSLGSSTDHTARSADQTGSDSDSTGADSSTGAMTGTTNCVDGSTAGGGSTNEMDNGADHAAADASSASSDAVPELSTSSSTRAAGSSTQSTSNVIAAHDTCTARSPDGTAGISPSTHGATQNNVCTAEFPVKGTAACSMPGTATVAAEADGAAEATVAATNAKPAEAMTAAAADVAGVQQGVLCVNAPDLSHGMPPRPVVGASTSEIVPEPEAAYLMGGAPRVFDTTYSKGPGGCASSTVPHSNSNSKHTLVAGTLKPQESSTTWVQRLAGSSHRDSNSSGLSHSSSSTCSATAGMSSLHTCSSRTYCSYSSRSSGGVTASKLSSTGYGGYKSAAARRSSSRSTSGGNGSCTSSCCSRRLLIIVPVLLLLAATGIVAWAWTYAGASSLSEGSLASAAMPGGPVLSFRVTMAVPSMAADQGCRQWFDSGQRITAYRQLLSAAYSKALQLQMPENVVQNITCAGLPTTALSTSTPAAVEPTPLLEAIAAATAATAERLEHWPPPASAAAAPAPTTGRGAMYAHRLRDRNSGEKRLLLQQFFRAFPTAVDVTTMLTFPDKFASAQERADFVKRFISQSAAALDKPMAQFFGVPEVMTTAVELLQPGLLIAAEAASTAADVAVTLPLSAATEDVNQPIITSVLPAATEVEVPGQEVDLIPTAVEVIGFNPDLRSPEPLASLNASSDLISGVHKFPNYKTAPTCPFAPSKTNSAADPQGRLWGWLNDTECVFRGPGHLAAKPKKVDWKTAVSCSDSPNEYNSVVDDNGRRWGWQNNKSCAFKKTTKSLRPGAVDTTDKQLPLAATFNDMKHHLPGRVSTVWEGAPTCISAPNDTNAVPDTFGRLWGWENNGSCAFRWQSLPS